MARARQTVREVAGPTVRATALEFSDRTYRLREELPRLFVVGGESDLRVGNYAQAEGKGLRVKLTPGASSYAAARAGSGTAFSDNEIVAAVLIAAVGGHPNADDDRAGTELSAVWSHHLAVVRGEDPRLIARTYAPTETKTIAWRIQNMAALGVHVLVSGPGTIESR